jgi:hypothetical protein
LLYKKWAKSINDANATSLVNVKVGSIANILAEMPNYTLRKMGAYMNEALAYVPGLYPFRAVLNLCNGR